jgi:hypothetical protein
MKQPPLLLGSAPYRSPSRSDFLRAGPMPVRTTRRGFRAHDMSPVGSNHLEERSTYQFNFGN